MLFVNCLIGCSAHRNLSKKKNVPFQVADLKKKLDAQNRDEMKTLAKKHKDKAELNRIKREAQTKHIQMAVQERQKVRFSHFEYWLSFDWVKFSILVNFVQNRNELLEWPVWTRTWMYDRTRHVSLLLTPPESVSNGWASQWSKRHVENLLHWTTIFQPTHHHFGLSRTFLGNSW